ncbi:PBECR2 nuclease fold domain-containing protein [Helicobacter cetorum]|uniref:DdrB-like domain-containing protein n=1 Tax=Helicobacter cetorum (strain ATCC BAA-429 / MIT 00-7128) TaxID=182217 RepID=I0ELL2_HELC0|nr:PBECR2 nuclease fold domain-containing protein [Helicobacter cetorum]AFI03831.1 hypothetical protein HCW_02750 [Helicobacter cetorum MIT 00-7128]
MCLSFKGFHKLFKNDVLIAKKLTEATTQKASQGLATSLEGAFKFLGVKWLLNTMYRTAPKTFIFKSLDEKTAGAALRYHLKQALERSHSVEEFTNTLKLSAQKSKFSNETMKKIEEITSGVKTASEEVKDKITKHEKALKELEKIDTSKLTKEQLDVLKVFKGELDETILKGRDLNDLYTLEKGSKKHGAIKILKRHYGENKTGAITSDELLNMGEVIKNGSVLLESKENRNNLIRYAYEWDNNGVKLRVVVDDLGDNKKIFNFYSDRPTGGSPTPRSTNQQIDITQKELTKQDQELSFLELANLEKQQKLAKEQELKELESQRLQESIQQHKLERQAIRDAKNSTLGKSELDREIVKSENIPFKELENAPKSSVSLNDNEIYPLKYVIVNKDDLKPNFKNTGTQTRNSIDNKKIEEIANNFDPKMIVGRGGFDDLPIILNDGQVIAGNHRTQGMLSFSKESRANYEKAIKDSFNLDLKPNELMVRMPENELNDKEIFKLASKSNENRANSFSDTLLSAMSSYNENLKHLPIKFESENVENLANNVARVLERDAKIPSQTQIENANLALLSHYAKNSANNSLLEVFDNAYKHLDKEQFKAFKEMFANNSANFHNLNNDATLKNFNLSPYLTDSLDTTAKMLESGNRKDNYAKLVNDIDYLVKTTDSNGTNAFIKENPQKYESVVSELLGSSFARFLRLENPTSQFYEFLKNAKERMIQNAGDIFAGTNKPISEINVFDFIKYAIESGNPSKESRELLDLLPKLESKFKAYEKHLKESKPKLEKERAFKVIEPKDKKAFIDSIDSYLKTDNAPELPKEINIDEFKNKFKYVSNLDNFIEHIGEKENAQKRFFYLNLIEPSLKEPDIKLIYKDKEPHKERIKYIKAFKKDENNIVHLFVSQDNNKLFITSVPEIDKYYIKSMINKADIIHSFIQQDSKNAKKH